MNMENKEKNWKLTFFPFWISQAFSLLGSSLVQFALVWWLTRETGSATVLATASMAALLPEMIIQPFAGAIIDRLDRKRLIILADILIAAVTLIVGLLFYLDKIAVWHIYAIMAVRAIGSAFHYPAQQASVSLMVPQEHLARIAGLNQAMRGIVNIIAAPMGALILEIADVEGAVLLDVLTALAAVGIISFIAIPKQQALQEKNGKWMATILSDMRDGFRYLVSWKGLMWLTALALIVKIALSPAFSLIPLLVNQHFQGDVTDYSMVEVAAGVGVILGGLLLGAWGGFKKRIYTMFVGFMGVGIGMLAMGFLPGDQFLLALAAVFLVGFMIPMVDGPMMAILQAKIDNEYQGRVFTIFGTLIWLSTPIGLAVAGPLSDRFGMQIWFVISGVLCFLILVFSIFSKTIRGLEEENVQNGKKKEPSYAGFAAKK